MDEALRHEVYTVKVARVWKNEQKEGEEKGKFRELKTRTHILILNSQSHQSRREKDTQHWKNWRREKKRKSVEEHDRQESIQKTRK